MSTTQNQTETPEAAKHVPVPAKEQWRRSALLGVALLIGSLISLGLIMALNLVLPADFQTSLYSGGQRVFMTVGIVGAILAGRNRYWGPMWTYIAFALIIGPAAWYGIYLLIFH